MTSDTGHNRGKKWAIVAVCGLTFVAAFLALIYLKRPDFAFDKESPPRGTYLLKSDRSKVVIEIGILTGSTTEAWTSNGTSGNSTAWPCYIVVESNRTSKVTWGNKLIVTNESAPKGVQLVTLK